MAQTTLSVRMDMDVKSQLDALCADVGMTTSTAINMFAKAFIRERRLPFDVVASDPFYSESNMKHLQRSIQQINEGKVVIKTMDELEEMANGNLAFSESGWDDYLYWQTEDKKTLKRINQLLQDILRNGYDGIGKPEPLRENLSGYWSRRIDATNRLVYRISGESIEVVSCRYHYDDK